MAQMQYIVGGCHAHSHVTRLLYMIPVALPEYCCCMRFGRAWPPFLKNTVYTLCVEAARTCIKHAHLQVFNGTEANPDFAADIQATLDISKKKGAVLVCNIGGSLEASQANQLGRQSRCPLTHGLQARHRMNDHGARKCAQILIILGVIPGDLSSAAQV